MTKPSKGGRNNKANNLLKMTRDLPAFANVNEDDYVSLSRSPVDISALSKVSTSSEDLSGLSDYEDSIELDDADQLPTEIDGSRNELNGGVTKPISLGSPHKHSFFAAVNPESSPVHVGKNADVETPHQELRKPNF
jgi:hypothetical protein